MKSIKLDVLAKKSEKQAGVAMVIALVVMALLLGFVALVLSRTVTESAITMNDTAESRTFNAAEAALEDATRDFATVVENNFVVPAQKITDIQNKPVPYFEENGYTFTKTITRLEASKTETLTTGTYAGLISLRDKWQIEVNATNTMTGVQAKVRRRFFNDRIPIFQFGAFYQDDLEVNDPPLFIFNGRIHTNGNFFANSNGSGIYFKSKITAAGEIVRDRWKNSAALTSAEQSNEVYAPNASLVDTQMPTNRGSVTCTSGTGGILKDVTNRNFPYPNCTANSNWATAKQTFEGNVVNQAKPLTLPVSKLGFDLIEMVRRGKNVGDLVGDGTGSPDAVTSANEDQGALARERYANKEGIRISLSDSKQKLPGCAASTTLTDDCGVQLDRPLSGSSSLGYKPLAMTDGYQATTLNGNRFSVSGRQVWIKIELVKFDYDNEVPVTKDVTQDILSLGVTEPIIDASVPNLSVAGYSTTTDSRSIVKLQRFAVEGKAIGNPSATKYTTAKSINGKDFNFVQRFGNIPASGLGGCFANPSPCVTNAFAPAATNGSNSVSTDETAHYKLASFDNNVSKSFIVPFPIELFDTREGNLSDATTGLTTDYVYKNGVMSIVDIDVANLRKFLNGDFNGVLPTTTPYAVLKNNVSLKNTDVPSNRGWVVYFSDRRGDYDFDGRYKMEEVNTSGHSTVDEDLDNNGTIDVDYTNEAPTKDSNGDSTEIEAGYSAVTDHSFYRRGVRLINGTTLPGNYDTTTPENTTGFTFASENGIYVLGNYNVSSVNVAGGTSSTTSDRYSPQNTALHIPASIVGDAVTVLSNAWNDSESFDEPLKQNSRVAENTQVRFAMLAGDPLTGYSPNAGISGKQNGGLINFKRFLESWSNKRLNYSGSLINLFNSFNSNGRHKCCNTVYNPPIRDWTFEDSFTTPSRLPPGTPFVYYITFTGFERVND